MLVSTREYVLCEHPLNKLVKFLILCFGFTISSDESCGCQDRCFRYLPLSNVNFHRTELLNACMQ